MGWARKRWSHNKYIKNFGKDTSWKIGNEIAKYKAVAVISLEQCNKSRLRY